jgi:hypothetical protein
MLTAQPHCGWTCRSVRKGSQIAPKGVADLLLEERDHRKRPSVMSHSGGTEPPESPVFCGQKKRPNVVAKILLYLLILYR